MDLDRFDDVDDVADSEDARRLSDGVEEAVVNDVAEDRVVDDDDDDDEEEEEAVVSSDADDQSELANHFPHPHRARHTPQHPRFPPS